MGGALLLAAFASGGSPPPPAPALVLHGATVIDGDGVLAGVADVVVRGELIHAVAARCEHPPGAEVLDLTGRYLLPGFVDMHAHLLEHGRDAEAACSRPAASSIAAAKATPRSDSPTCGRFRRR